MVNHPEKGNQMMKFFTPLFLFLLLMTGVGQAFGENLIKYPEKLDIKLIDLSRVDFRSLYHPVYRLDKISQVWKLHLDMNKGAENQGQMGTKPILNFGSIPEVMFKYQPDTVVQWGHTLRDLILLMRIDVKADNLPRLDMSPRHENNNFFLANLNFNFLVDFWFK
jgi:hypothetical protein